MSSSPTPSPSLDPHLLLLHAAQSAQATAGQAQRAAEEAEERLRRYLRVRAEGVVGVGENAAKGDTTTAVAIAITNNSIATTGSGWTGSVAGAMTGVLETINTEEGRESGAVMEERGVSKLKSVTRSPENASRTAGQGEGESVGLGGEGNGVRVREGAARERGRGKGKGKEREKSAAHGVVVPVEVVAQARRQRKAETSGDSDESDVIHIKTPSTEIYQTKPKRKRPRTRPPKPAAKAIPTAPVPKPTTDRPQRPQRPPPSPCASDSSSLPELTPSESEGQGAGVATWTRAVVVVGGKKTYGPRVRMRVDGVDTGFNGRAGGKDVEREDDIPNANPSPETTVFYGESRT